MSWLDRYGISSALKNAQKKIDNVLDISDPGEQQRRPPQAAGSSREAPKKEAAGDDFWSSWLGSEKTKLKQPKQAIVKEKAQDKTITDDLQDVHSKEFSPLKEDVISNLPITVQVSPRLQSSSSAISSDDLHAQAIPDSASLKSADEESVEHDTSISDSQFSDEKLQYPDVTDSGVLVDDNEVPDTIHRESYDEGSNSSELQGSMVLTAIDDHERLDEIISSANAIAESNDDNIIDDNVLDRSILSKDTKHLSALDDRLASSAHSDDLSLQNQPDLDENASQAGSYVCIGPQGVVSSLDKDGKLTGEIDSNTNQVVAGLMDVDKGDKYEEQGTEEIVEGNQSRTFISDLGIQSSPTLADSKFESFESSESSKLDSSMDTFTSEDTVIERLGIVDKENVEGQTTANSSLSESVSNVPDSSSNDELSQQLDDVRSECTDGHADKQSRLVEDADSSGSPNECEVKEQFGDSVSSTSSSNSYVKFMIEEAMEDGAKVDTTSHHEQRVHIVERFDPFSDRSASIHDSSEDVDTTTSSDIEIISTPTTSGDSGDRHIDLSPVKIALSKSARYSAHGARYQRTDSQSSSSTHSKATESDQLSPSRDSLERQDVDSEESRTSSRSSQDEHSLRLIEFPALDEEDNPYHPQRLLKKLAEITEVLQARETKIMNLSQENNDLLETNSILRNQLLQSEEEHKEEMADIQQVTEEFTRRLSEAEARYQTAIREKEKLKKHLQSSEDLVTKMTNDTTMVILLEEKEQQITELLQEGEKLSKQQLQTNTLLKKLRSKEKETDTKITDQSKKLNENTTELEHLKKVLDAKEKGGKQSSDAITQLNSAVQQQDSQITRLKGEMEDADEKARGLQVALDNSYREIAELHKVNAARDSKVQEVALSTEIQLRDELKLMMERDQRQARQEKDGLVMQIEDLQYDLTRMEKECSRREDILRQEILRLQMQLQEDESRNQELSHSVTTATRPLLRQIENLQNTYASQSETWEVLERNLSSRLGESQTQLATATEKERSANERLLQLSTKVASFEAQIAQLRPEKCQLTAQLEVELMKVSRLEDEKNSEVAKIEIAKKMYEQEKSELVKEKLLLDAQLDMERSLVDNEKKKVLLLQEQLRDMETKNLRMRGTPSPISSSTLSQDEHPSIMDRQNSSIFSESNLLERSLMLSSPNGTRENLYESLRLSSASSLLESLQSQLKQRDGEMIQLQTEISQLEKTRELMTRELVRLTTLNDDLQDQVESLPSLRENLVSTQQRYNTVLQMYGEKVEEKEELSMDLQDVKEMYKAQINHLLDK